MSTEPISTANWKPLESAVPASWLPDFMHMGEHESIQLYKRRDNRRYLNIDSDGQRFYQYRDGRYIEVDRTTAILDSLGIRNWDIPISALASAPARLRAASVLTAFLEFQRNVHRADTEYRVEELAAVVRLLSRVGYGLEKFPEMSMADIGDAECDRALKHEVRLLLQEMATLAVPCSWLPDEEASARPAVPTARLWQEFCVRLAAEVGKEPIYGCPVAEPPLASSVTSCPSADVPMSSRSQARWRTWLAFLIDWRRNRRTASVPVGLK